MPSTNSHLNELLLFAHNNKTFLIFVHMQCFWLFFPPFARVSKSFFFSRPFVHFSVHWCTLAGDLKLIESEIKGKLRNCYSHSFREKKEETIKQLKTLKTVIKKFIHVENLSFRSSRALHKFVSKMYFTHKMSDKFLFFPLLWHPIPWINFNWLFAVNTRLNRFFHHN